jgi:hypothetical protein
MSNLPLDDVHTDCCGVLANTSAGEYNNPKKQTRGAYCIQSQFDCETQLNSGRHAGEAWE